MLGGLVGKSAEWVKAVEKGRLLPPRLSMLERISAALRVPLPDLVGNESPQIQALTGPAHAALAGVRSAINAQPSPTVAQAGLNELSERVSTAWRARHASPEHRTTLGALPPALIRDTRTASAVCGGAQRRIALGLESDVLGLTQMFLAYQPAAELLWRVAERSMVTAQESGDAHARAMAAWFMIEALRDAGDWDSAMEVNRSALDDAERHAEGGADVVAMIGALHTLAALTAARAGEEGRARRHRNNAEQVVRRLPSGYVHRWTWFSPEVAGFYALSVAVELRKGAEAVCAAGHVDPAAIASRQRRARHLVEVARAHHLRADAEAALGAVRKAMDAAPETVRYNAHARRIVLDLCGDATRRGAAGRLAAEIGL